MWARGFRYYFTPLPGCFSPFPHGTSSLSVARECLALGGGPPRFARDFSGPALLGNNARRSVAFRLQGCYLLWRPVPWPSSTCRLCHASSTPARTHAGPTTPNRQRHRAVTPARFRLIPVRSPLLGESRLLSLPRPTEMFHFGRFPPQALCVQTWVTGHDPGRVSPFGHLRITALSAAPRSFSQPDASFIGSWRQGIHRKPFIT